MSQRNRTQQKYPAQNFWIGALVGPLLIASVANTNGDRSFRGDRRPGILAEPSEVPTGENALIFTRLGTFSAAEMLDLVSEPVREN